jgi:hypothetical protein
LKVRTKFPRDIGDPSCNLLTFVLNKREELMGNLPRLSLKGAEFLKGVRIPDKGE